MRCWGTKNKPRWSMQLKNKLKWVKKMVTDSWVSLRRSSFPGLFSFFFQTKSLVTCKSLRVSILRKSSTNLKINVKKEIPLAVLLVVMFFFKGKLDNYSDIIRFLKDPCFQRDYGFTYRDEISKASSSSCDEFLRMAFWSLSGMLPKQ